MKGARMVAARLDSVGAGADLLEPVWRNGEPARTPRLRCGACAVRGSIVADRSLLAVGFLRPQKPRSANGPNEVGMLGKGWAGEAMESATMCAGWIANISSPLQYNSCPLLLLQTPTGSRPSVDMKNLAFTLEDGCSDHYEGPIGWWFQDIECWFNASSTLRRTNLRKMEFRHLLAFLDEIRDRDLYLQCLQRFDGHHHLASVTG